MKSLDLDNLTIEENKLFNEIALDIRQEYNLLIENISAIHAHNIHWIVGSIASRNKYQSPLFYRCCQLSFVKKQIEIHKKIDEIILSDRPLACILKNQLPDNIKITCTENSIRRVWRLFRPIRQYLIGFFFLLLRFLGRSKDHIKKQNFSKPIVLVDTFVLNNKAGDEGSINNGKYKDRYYPGLLENLTYEEKKNLYFIPTIVGFLNPVKIFKKIRTVDFPFLIHDDFLKLSDYLFVLQHPFKAIRLKINNASFRGFNVESIVIQENKRNCSDFISLLGILYYRFAYRLMEQKIKVRLLIEWYENQVMDRGMIVGFHKFHPETLIIGYQGYIISKGLHIYTQPNNTEFIGNAVPDIVAVTGKGLKNNILEFCKDINVQEAPGFRFQKLWRDRKLYPGKNIFTVLIGLPIGLDDSKYILELICSNPELAENKSIHFHIKPHPTWSPEKIKGLLPNGKLDGFHFVLGDFHDSLEVVNLVISNASSVALESLAKGTPVIIIAPSTGILQNPIPDEINKKCWSVCYTSEDIKNEIFSFIKKQNENLIDFSKIGNEIKDYYFEPVTRKSVMKFLHLN